MSNPEKINEYLFRLSSHNGTESTVNKRQDRRMKATRQVDMSLESFTRFATFLNNAKNKVDLKLTRVTSQ